MKACLTCKITKDLLDFHKSKANRDGRAGECKLCMYARQMRWNNANKARKKAFTKKSAEKAYASNPEKFKAQSALYRKNNPQKIKELSYSYYRSNAELLSKKNKAWRLKNKDKILAYKAGRKPIRAAQVRDRLRTDLNFKLTAHLRSRLSRAIKLNYRSESSAKLLGCSIESFKLYLESKFEDGMSWDNYGLNGWHIDHIMPCAIFDLTKPEHQKRCFHFSNMQPLWGNDNVRKGSKITTPQFNLPI